MNKKAKKMKAKRIGQARLDVWLKIEMKQQIQGKAKKLGLSVADYVRNLFTNDLKESA